MGAASTATAGSVDSLKRKRPIRWDSLPHTWQPTPCLFSYLLLCFEWPRLVVLSICSAVPSCSPAGLPQHVPVRLGHFTCRLNGVERAAACVYVNCSGLGL